MTSKRTAQTNQQQKNEKPHASGILQRAAVRLVSDAGVQSTEDKEAQPLSNSAFSKDFSRVPISTTKPQQIMAKLTIGTVGDKYEQEADRVAAQVVQRLNAPASVPSGEDETVQREEMETKSNKARMMRSPILQRKSSNGGMAAKSDLEASINRARGGGRLMENNVRKRMEQGFGADFSGVKIHTDAQSDQLNRSIQARAFTTGHDVFFRQGEYNPGSRGGQELIAHELTHVVQQNDSQLQRKLEEQKLLTEQEVPNIGVLQQGSILQRYNEYEQFLPEDVETNYTQQEEEKEKLDKAIKNIKEDRLDDEDKQVIKSILEIRFKQINDRYKNFKTKGEKAGKQGEEAVKEGWKQYLMEGVHEAKAFASIPDTGKDKKKIYLGSLIDTSKKADEKEGKNISRILNQKNWSLAANAAFIEGGKESNAVFKLTTDIGQDAKEMLIDKTKTGLTGNEFKNWVTNQEKPRALWDKKNNRITVLTIEICQLINYKYKFQEKEMKHEDGKKRLVAVKPDGATKHSEKLIRSKL